MMGKHVAFGTVLSLALTTAGFPGSAAEVAPPALMGNDLTAQQLVDNLFLTYWLDTVSASVGIRELAEATESLENALVPPPPGLQVGVTHQYSEPWDAKAEGTDKCHPGPSADRGTGRIKIFANGQRLDDRIPRCTAWGMVWTWTRFFPAGSWEGKFDWRETYTKVSPGGANNGGRCSTHFASADLVGAVWDGTDGRYVLVKTIFHKDTNQQPNYYESKGRVYSSGPGRFTAVDGHDYAVVMFAQGVGGADWCIGEAFGPQTILNGRGSATVKKA